MALFHVSSDGLVPLRPVAASAPVSAAELCELLWRDIDTVLGERLFRIRFGPSPLDEQRLAIFALDNSGNIVIITVSRTLDTAELAGALENIGWSRSVSVSELADVHWRGAEDFWRDWRRFSGAAVPPSMAGKPRLVIVATDVSPATATAMDFLLEHNLPVTVLAADIYEDPEGRRLLEVTERDRPEARVSRERLALTSPRGSRQRAHTSGSLPHLPGYATGSLPVPSAANTSISGEYAVEREQIEDLDGVADHSVRRRNSDTSRRQAQEQAYGAVPLDSPGAKETNPEVLGVEEEYDTGGIDLSQSRAPRPHRPRHLPGELAETARRESGIGNDAPIWEAELVSGENGHQR